MERAVLPDGLVLVRGLSRVRDALVAAGYTIDGLRTVLGSTAEISPARADRVVHDLRSADRPGPLTDVIMLLALGRRVARDKIVAALGQDAVDVLIASGSVVEIERGLRAQVRITPHGDLWIASDAVPPSGRESDPWYVTGINPPATLLATLTVRRPVSRALDLGTGNGIQALLASRHCDTVIATDVNPRAVAFGRFNAALNAIDSIEFRQGSWFEPVGGETFDLIVSNPPYVISPDNDLVYRDSGDEPGALCGRLVADLPRHLAENGVAVMLASWPISGDDWSVVPSSWPGPRCRAWIVQMHVDDPIDHARSWNRPLAENPDLDEYDAAVGRWVRFARQRGFIGVGYGAVVLVRRGRRRGVIRSDSARTAAGSAGDHVERVLANDTVEIPDIATAVFRIAAGVQLQRDIVSDGGLWRDGSTRISVTDGLVVDMDFDALMTQVLVAATSGLAVGAAADHIATAVGLEASRHDDLRAAACAMMRELFSLGLAELVDREPA